MQFFNKFSCCLNYKKHDKYSLLWSFFVLFSFIFQITMNVLSADLFGSFGGGDNSEISIENPTFITPDNLTFLVWTLIYSFQLLFTVYQFMPCFQSEIEGNTRLYVTVLFILNGLWLPVFANKLFFLSWFIMIGMIYSLINIYKELEINYGYVSTDLDYTKIIPNWFFGRTYPNTIIQPSWHKKLFVFFPFSINLAWLNFAIVANTLISLGNAGWKTTVEYNQTNYTITQDFNGNVDFSIFALVLYTSVCYFIMIRYDDFPYGLVCIWALFGILRANSSLYQTPENIYKNVKIADWSFICLMFVSLGTILSIIKTIYDNLKAKRIIENILKNQIRKPKENTIQIPKHSIKNLSIDVHVGNPSIENSQEV